MAGPRMIVLGLLLLAFCAHCISPTGSVIIPSSCCMSFTSKKIQENRVVSYQVANRSVCPKAGVIFTTKKGLKFCGDPKQAWVQKYIRNLDAKRKRSSSGPRPVGVKGVIQRHCGNNTAF
ncbi:C-C motif chemokine 24 [Castor canadensis]|uniref:C-C motif chemokine 24 n=3 Tax=Castor canadensis TaxID=51338 RepID=A0A250YMJ6_CASCN|nr:C-C motif chemokine 24 [Castor canadensis]